MPRREQVAAALRYLQDKADLKRRYERMTSLDQPTDSDAADMAIEMGASMVPGVSQALAARDFERARRAGDEAGMGMAAASALPLGRLAGALKRYDPAMQKITETEFEALAKTGKIHPAKNAKQELESLRQGQSEVAEIRADADTVEGDELLQNLKQEGYAIEPSPVAFDSWIVGKNKEAISKLKNAKSPVDFGRAYGYSDADIAQFYMRRRGGDKTSAFREYLSDLSE
jgi:hypothetical protein